MQVVRYRVFETNSSSTHSLCIKKCTLNKKADNNASFEIRSIPAKIVWFRGLLLNALNEFDNKKQCEYTKEIDQKVKTALLNIAKEELPDLYEKIFNYFSKEVIDEMNAFALQRFIISLDYKQILDTRSYDMKVNAVCNYLLEEDARLRFLSEFSNILIDAYMEIENISNKKALSNINKESRGKIGFCPYFEEGALQECYCGFEDSKALLSQLWQFNIDQNSTQEELLEGAKKFLSKDYKIVAEELHGDKKIGKGTIY